MKFKHTYKEYQDIFNREHGEGAKVVIRVPNVFPTLPKDLIHEAAHKFMFYLWAIEDSQEKIAVPSFWGDHDDYLNKIDKKTYHTFFPELDETMADTLYDIGYRLFVHGNDDEYKDITECEGFSIFFPFIAKGEVKVGQNITAEVEIIYKDGEETLSHIVIGVTRYDKQEYIQINSELKDNRDAFNYKED